MSSNAVAVLGRSTGEYNGLLQQSNLLATPTRDMLRAAGIAAGMRILDVGCGAGDLTMQAAALAGREGSVVGLDRDADVLRFAQRRADEAGAANVRFVRAAICKATEAFAPGEFDAIVGRFVLVHQNDPARALGSLVPLLRPAGVVAFLEPELGRAAHIEPAVPLLEDWTERLQRTLALAGVQMNMGSALAGTFVRAGLPLPMTKVSVVAGGGPDYFGYDYWAEAARSMAPAMRRLGVLAADEGMLETLGGELRDAIVSAKSCMTTQVVVAAWVRSPEAT